jgi:hypothetical protein
VMDFSIPFSWAFSDHCFLSFSYCVKLSLLVDCFVFCMDMNQIVVEFLCFRLSLLDWSITSNAVGCDDISIRFLRVFFPFILVYSSCYSFARYLSVWTL